MVALKHDCKRYLESFFLVVLCEDLHIDSDQLIEKKLNIQWLEQPEEDFIAYESGNQDHQNSLALKSCEIRGTRFVLSSVEEQRLKVLVNGPLNPDYSDSSNDDAKESSDSGEEASESLPDHSHQPTTLGAGHSRSGRRTTRFQL